MLRVRERVEARASLGLHGSSLSTGDDVAPQSDPRSEVLSFLSGALRGDVSIETLFLLRRLRGRFGEGLSDPENLDPLELSESLVALVEDNGLDTLSRKGKSTVGLEPGGENIDGCLVTGLISRALAVGFMLGFSGSSSELDDDE